MEILRHAFFRVTRDADFTVSDEADDLLRAVEDELRRRRFGEAVRLEVSRDMDPRMREYLIEQLAIDEGQVVDVEGLLDLEDLWSLYELDGHRELRDPPWQPVPKPEPSERGRHAPTCSPPCARATCWCTTPTTRSRAAWSASCSRRWRTPTCSR